MVTRREITIARRTSLIVFRCFVCYNENYYAFNAGRQKIRLKIVLTYEKDRDEAVRILNEMTVDINRGLCGIEFTKASAGSIELHVEILIGLFVTDKNLLTNIHSLMNNVMQLGVLDMLSNESIDVYLIFEEGLSVFILI